MFGELIDEDIVRAAGVEGDETGLGDGIEVVCVLTDPVADAFRMRVDQHVFCVPQRGFKQAKEGFAPRAAAFLGCHSMRHAKLGCRQRRERPHMRAHGVVNGTALAATEVRCQLREPPARYMGHHEEGCPEGLAMAVVLDELGNGDPGMGADCLEHRAFRHEEMLLMSKEPHAVPRWTFEHETAAIAESGDVDLPQKALDEFHLLDSDS